MNCLLQGHSHFRSYLAANFPTTNSLSPSTTPRMPTPWRDLTAISEDAPRGVPNSNSTKSLAFIFSVWEAAAPSSTNARPEGIRSFPRQRRLVLPRHRQVSTLSTGSCSDPTFSNFAHREMGYCPPPPYPEATEAHEDHLRILNTAVQRETRSKVFGDVSTKETECLANFVRFVGNPLCCFPLPFILKRRTPCHPGGKALRPGSAMEESQTSLG